MLSNYWFPIVLQLSFAMLSRSFGCTRLLTYAQNPLHLFIHRFPIDGKVTNLLRTCYGHVMDLLRGSNRESGVMDFLKACYREVYKVHYELVAVSMPLELKHHPGPTRTENSLAYYISATSVDYQKNSFFFCTVRDWNYLPEETVLASTPESFRNYISP